MAMDDFEPGGEEELAAYDAAPVEEQEDDLFDFAGLNDLPESALSGGTSTDAPAGAVKSAVRSEPAAPRPKRGSGDLLDDFDFGDDLSAPHAPLPGPGSGNATPGPAISDPGLNEDAWRALDELQAQQEASSPKPRGADRDATTADGRDRVSPAASAARHATHAPLTVGSASLRLPPVVVLLLFILVAVNSAVLLLGLRSQNAVQDLIVDVGQDVITSTEALRNEAARTRDTVLGERSAPLVDPGPEGYAALARAEEALDAGDFRTARQALFALQAVRDRLDPTSRDDVLARARFLIGQSYLAEARLRAASGGEQ